jgi:hypothetical protein
LTEYGALAISRSGIFQFFKYAVYAFLGLNLYIFFSDELAAAPLRYPGGVPLSEFREAYAATIDTASWLVLLLMFELETYLLDDRHFTRTVTWTLHGLRALCYVVIVTAFFGYVDVLMFVSGATTLGEAVAACSLADGNWSWATTLGEYAQITAANCADYPASGRLYRLPEIAAVVDPAGLTEIIRLALVDVINAAVWILVVLVLEADVRLQEKGRYEGLVLRLSTFAKFVLYSLLLLACIYWWFKGGFVDFWDSFLWLVAFVFIELNVFDWRKEEAALAEAASR